MCNIIIPDELSLVPRDTTIRLQALSILISGFVQMETVGIHNGLRPCCDMYTPAYIGREVNHRGAHLYWWISILPLDWGKCPRLLVVGKVPNTISRVEA